MVLESTSMGPVCHQVTPLLPPLGLSFLLCKEMGLDYIKLSLISIIINGGTLNI